MRRLVTAIILSAIALSVAATPLRILYTNDLHLRFERLGGLATAIRQEREAARGSVLLLDAGDTWQDFRRPVAAVWGAESMVEWMNTVAYDAMAIGNHDLCWPTKKLEALSGLASFHLLCANLTPITGLEAPFEPIAIVTSGSLRVLIIGGVTEELLPYHDLPWLVYSAPEISMANEVARAGDDVDVIIGLVHLPVQDSIRLAEQIPEIDLWITGHSHESTEQPVQVGEALVVQAGAFGGRLGVLDLDIDPATGDVELEAHKQIAIETETSSLPREGLRSLLLVFAAMLATAAIMLL